MEVQNHGLDQGPKQEELPVHSKPQISKPPQSNVDYTKPELFQRPDHVSNMEDYAKRNENYFSRTYGEGSRLQPAVIPKLSTQPQGQYVEPNPYVTQSINDDRVPNTGIMFESQLK